jgi:cyclic pyranopterin phosphate synthase
MAPLHDAFNRTVDYLRVSVTDRCDLHCPYCNTGERRPLLRQAILSYEEIAAFAREAVRLGIRTIRITGGEPLQRRDVPALVRMLADIPGLEDLAMTTNGTRLAEQADALAAAGLRRVNVSLDAVDPANYAEHTGGGDVRDVLAGIGAAIVAGLMPVKLNCVVEHDADEPDARDVAAYAASHGLEARFIPRMDLARGTFHGVIGGRGGQCHACNRLRLSCDGYLRPCLFSDVSVPIRGLEPEEALRRALAAKPAEGGRAPRARMNRIGG